MFKNLDRKQGGFTIVEVMIVLAIAGLVLAIVFIAVPALQRNSRDAQRRADISAIQSGVATYIGNNNGQLPDTAAKLLQGAESIDFSFYNDGADASPQTHILAWVDTAAENKIYFEEFSTSAGWMDVQTSTTEAHDFAIYIVGAECDAVVAKGLFPADGGTIVQDGPSRSYALIYAVESDPNWQCIDNV